MESMRSLTCSALVAELEQFLGRAEGQPALRWNCWRLPALGLGDDESAANGEVGLACSSMLSAPRRGDGHAVRVKRQNRQRPQKRCRASVSAISRDPPKAISRTRASLRCAAPSDRFRASSGDGLQARVAPRSWCRARRRLRQAIRTDRHGYRPPRRTHPTCAGRRRTGRRHASALRCGNSTGRYRRRTARTR